MKQDCSRITYDGFGNILTDTTGVNGDRFKFTSREWDSTVKLQYNRARYYDPGIGKWISMDPLGFDAGDANLYRYVGDGSTNWVDPSGLSQVFYSKDGYRVAGDFQVGVMNTDPYTATSSFDSCVLGDEFQGFASINGVASSGGVCNTPFFDQSFPSNHRGSTVVLFSAPRSGEYEIEFEVSANLGRTNYLARQRIPAASFAFQSITTAGGGDLMTLRFLGNETIVSERKKVTMHLGVQDPNRYYRVGLALEPVS